jgi:tetratricopeptide (TPR) repeat protein
MIRRYPHCSWARRFVIEEPREEQMAIGRREFLGHLALSATLTSAACRAGESSSRVPAAGEEPDPDQWSQLRQQFSLSPEYIHMSALLIVSHPAPVREAIEQYRRVVRLDPQHALALYNLGVLLERAGDAAAALDHYSRAAVLSPDLQLGAKARARIAQLLADPPPVE